RGGATAGTGLTGVAVVLRLSPAPVAQTAHHQRDRALLRGSATENPTYGVLCERRKCGPHHLLHLPEIQSGMENPHPQPIYTSCLTSPNWWPYLTSVNLLSYNNGSSSHRNISLEKSDQTKLTNQYGKRLFSAKARS